MKKFSYFLIIILFAFSHFIHSQSWQKIPFTYPASVSAGFKIFASQNSDIVITSLHFLDPLPSYISLDAGNSWNPIFTNKPIAAAKFSADGYIYLITARKIQTYVYALDSLFRSFDGLNWVNLGKIPDGGFGTEGSDDGDYFITKNNTLLFPFNLTPLSGPYLSKSVNRGSTWSNTAYFGSLTSIAASPNADTIAIGTYNSGVRFSTDAGVTFNTSSGNFGNATYGGMVYHPSGKIYAASLGGVLVSTNGGADFSALAPNPWIALNFTKFEFSNTNNNFYIKGLNNVWETPDCISYTSIAGGLPNVANIKDLAIGKNYIFAVTDSNVYRYAINSATSVRNSNFTHSGIEFYPTPSNGKLKFRADKNFTSENTGIEIFNIIGQRIYSASLLNSEIDLSAFPNGIYILKIKNGLNVFTNKFLLRK